MQRRKLFQRVFLLGLAAALAIWGLRSERVGAAVCEQIREKSPRVPGLRVTIGHCQLEPWELAVDLRDVAVTYEGELGADIKADRAALQLQVWRGLYDRSPVRIELLRPTVNLDLVRVLQKPSTPSPPTTCQVNELLREIPLGNVLISDGTAHVDLPAKRSVDLRHLELTERNHHGVALIRFSEQGGNLAYGTGDLPLDRLTLGASLDTTEGTVEISRLEVAAGQLSVLAHGSARDFCDPDLQLEANLGVPMDLVSSVLDTPQFNATGYVSASGRMSGRLDHPNAHADLEVSDLEMFVVGQHLDPRDFTASLDLRDDRLELGQFYWPLGDGYGRISGSLELHDNFPFTANVEGKNIPFGELFNHLPIKHPWVDALASVKSKQVGHLFPTPTFAGPVSADFNDFHVRTRAWDAPPEPGDEVLGFKHEHVDANFDFTPERVHLTKVHVSGPTADLTAECTLSTDVKKGFDLTADLKSLDLDEVGGMIAGLPWKGRVSAQARIGGPYGPPTVDAEIQIQDFTMVMVHLGDTRGRLRFDPSMVLRFEDVVAVKNGRTSYGGDGLIDFSKGGQPIGGGDVRIANGRVEDLLQVLRDVHWSFEDLDGQLTGLVSGSIHLKPSPLLAPTSDFDLRFSSLSLYQRPLGSTELLMHTEAGDSITVAPMTLDGTLGTLTFSGWQRVGGELNYQLGLKDVLMPVASAPELTSWALNGTLHGQLAITGPSTQPRVAGDIYGSDLSAFGVPLGFGHVKVHDEGPSMAVTGAVGNDVNLDLSMRWEGPLPMKAKLTVAAGDLFPYVPSTAWWSDVGGELRGTLDVEGSLRDSGSFHGQLALPRVRVSKGDFALVNLAPVKLGFQGDLLEVQSFAFDLHREGEHDTSGHLTLSGTREGEDDRLALRLDGSADGRLVGALFPSLVEDTTGELTFGGRVTGTQARPKLVGTLDVKHGHLKVRDQDVVADDLHGQLVFSQASVSIPEGLDGTINHGKARLTGAVKLAGFSPATYGLQLSLDDSRFTFAGWPPVTVQGELDYEGSASDPTVGGSLDVRHFVYSENLDFKALLDSLKAHPLEARMYSHGERLWRYSGLNLDIGKEPDDQVSVDNNLLKARLRGQLAVLGDNTHPQLRGQIDGLPGAQAFWLGNTYNINDLALEFTEKNGLTPDFDAHAKSQVRDYGVTVHAFGSMGGKFTIDLQSSPELSQSNLVALLNFGYTTRDRGGANDQLAGIAGAGIGTLTQLAGFDQLGQRYLPKEGTLVSDPSFKLTTTYSLKVGTMQPTAEFDGKIFGKLLKDKLSIHLEQQAGNSNATKAQVLYHLTPSTSLKLMYDGDNSDQYTFPDVGGDLQFHTVVR